MSNQIIPERKGVRKECFHYVCHKQLKCINYNKKVIYTIYIVVSFHTKHTK